jgi:hypothetical protein
MIEYELTAPWPPDIIDPFSEHDKYDTVCGDWVRLSLNEAREINAEAVRQYINSQHPEWADGR